MDAPWWRCNEILYGKRSRRIILVESLFIERAAQEAAEAEIIEGDPRAEELLSSTRSMIYHWPADFEGFEASVCYCEDDSRLEGELRCGGSRKIELDIPELEDGRWARYQVEELVAHREAPSVSKMASKSGCSWGDYDEIYGQRIDFLGDKMSSFYRIKDSKITQIGRSYKTQSFIINIDDHQLCNGRYAARGYSAYYWDKADSALRKVETYYDSYEELEGVYLPTERRVTEVADKNFRCRSLLLRELKLL